MMRMAKTNSRRRGWKLFLPPMLAAMFLISCGKPVDPAPMPKVPAPFEFLGAWGEKGDGPAKFDRPTAFATDALGRVFFVDPGARSIDKFESMGTPLLSFEDARLRHASGIAVDSGGAIYVADAESGRILIFYPNGIFLRSLRSPRQPDFSGPLEISVDDQGSLYVPNPAASRVLKLNNHGRLLKSWVAPRDAAADGEKPTGIATARDGSVFVSYSKTGRIEKYSSDGAWITSWIAGKDAAGQSHPITGLAVGDQFVFTMAANSPHIRVWTLDGQSKLDVDLGEHFGTDPIAEPQIAVTPHSELLVFDPSVSRIYWFRMHLETLETKEQK